MFIPIEEAIKKGIPIVGQGKKSEFIVSSMTYIEAKNNSLQADYIKNRLNKSLRITDYTNRLKQLTITFVIYPEAWNGVNRKEQMYYDNEKTNLFLDLKIVNYSHFIAATKQEALSIMATEILRGVAKFLSNVKDFKYELFYADLERLFKEHQLI